VEPCSNLTQFFFSRNFHFRKTHFKFKDTKHFLFHCNLAKKKKKKKKKKNKRRRRRRRKEEDEDEDEEEEEKKKTKTKTKKKKKKKTKKKTVHSRNPPARHRCCSAQIPSFLPAPAPAPCSCSCCVARASIFASFELQFGSNIVLSFLAFFSIIRYAKLLLSAPSSCSVSVSFSFAFAFFLICGASLRFRFVRASFWIKHRAFVPRILLLRLLPDLWR
jgi:hypothetical protein